MSGPRGAKERRRSVGFIGIGLMAFTLCFGAPAAAEETQEDYRLKLAFLSRFGRDFREVVRSPLRWDGGDFLTFAAVSGTGLLIFAFDQEFQNWTQEGRSSSSDKAASFFSFLGDGVFLVGLTAAVYAAGEIGESLSLRRTAWLSLESLAAASLLTWMIKPIAGRARPSADESSRHFHPFAFKNTYWSLPSGHAAASFAVATAIADQTRSALVDGLAYGLATLVGLSRIHENKHWASDVFFGSALGYFVAKRICRLHSRDGGQKISLGLDLSAGRRALTLSIAL